MVENSMNTNEDIQNSNVDESLWDENTEQIYLDEENVTPLDISNLEFLN